MIPGLSELLGQQALSRMQAQEDAYRRAYNIGLGGLAAYSKAPQPLAINSNGNPLSDGKTYDYKPSIEAGDNIRDVLQAETDDWLKEINYE